MTAGARPLLAAKLIVPLPRPGAVPRRRLHELLDGSAGRRLTVVVAPAGWGKTTLLSASAAHILILDDYHLLRGPAIQESVEFLLSYLPPTLHLVIAARADPPRWRWCDSPRGGWPPRQIPGRLSRSWSGLSTWLGTGGRPPCCWVG